VHHKCMLMQRRQRLARKSTRSGAQCPSSDIHSEPRACGALRKHAEAAQCRVHAYQTARPSVGPPRNAVRDGIAVTVPPGTAHACARQRGQRPRAARSAQAPAAQCCTRCRALPALLAARRSAAQRQPRHPVQLARGSACSGRARRAQTARPLPTLNQLSRPASAAQQRRRVQQSAGCFIWPSSRLRAPARPASRLGALCRS
jgi:hypothetical protein